MATTSIDASIAVAAVALPLPQACSQVCPLVGLPTDRVGWSDDHPHARTSLSLSISRVLRRVDLGQTRPRSVGSTGRRLRLWQRKGLAGMCTSGYRSSPDLLGSFPLAERPATIDSSTNLRSRNKPRISHFSGLRSLAVGEVSVNVGASAFANHSPCEHLSWGF